MSASEKRPSRKRPQTPAERPYAYVHRMYGLDFRPGLRVRLENSDCYGIVARMKASAGHHVQVRFDGQAHASPCHPESLSILADSSEAA